MAKRIIIVEDSREIGRMIQAALTSLNANQTVELFLSAEEALLIASRYPVDLIVSDIRLPGRSGIELVRMMRQRQPNCRVIFISGITDPMTLLQAKQIQSDGFFQKPLDMLAFMQAARTALEKSSHYQHAQPEPVTKLAPPIPTKPELAEVQIPSVKPSEPKKQPTSTFQALNLLRQNLEAQAAFLMDDIGRVVEMAGELPKGQFGQDWAQRMLDAFSAAHKAARLVREAPAPLVIALQGEEYHLAMAPVKKFAVVVLLKPGQASDRMGKAVEEIMLAQPVMVELVEKCYPVVGSTSEGVLNLNVSKRAEALPVSIQVPQAPPTPPLPVPITISIPEPEALDQPTLVEFSQKLDATDQIVDQDLATAFWEDLAGGTSSQSQYPNAITYHQAQQLGLASDEI